MDPQIIIEDFAGSPRKTKTRCACFSRAPQGRRNANSCQSRRWLRAGIVPSSNQCAARMRSLSNPNLVDHAKRVGGWVNQYQQSARASSPRKGRRGIDSAVMFSACRSVRRGRRRSHTAAKPITSARFKGSRCLCTGGCGRVKTAPLASRGPECRCHRCGEAR